MSLSPSPSTLAQSSDLAVETEASTAAIITPPSQSTDVAPARELEPSSADVNPNDGKLTHLIIDAAAIIKGAGMILASASEVIHFYRSFSKQNWMVVGACVNSILRNAASFCV